ncbi:hypothetical protein H6G76_02000 [Nostoc sp. FACHB-152]|uniref:hypothetical protein n=1 Tax=unclassified Nostoc TaxID=2593658 RepID=UPI001681F7D4|nr:MULTISPECIES: hypothetical protein [unclassified Nostoc]MBD2445945.1 hypothetical protein [Nostoc sp. FACHB-152]MBD2467879.1 hypothetical protein [Nostoc sp. FACHB-145]
MSQKLTVQEFGIVIAVKNHQPTILNPDFLKYSGIVPADWELARQTIFTNNVVQITYTSGINIVAEPNRIMFLEAIEGKELAQVMIPDIVRKYVQALPNLEYEALGINPRKHITFEQQHQASKYLSEKLLLPGEWQEIGQAKVRASLNLAYTLERSPFYLSINEAAIRQEDETMTPIVMFNGSFSYELSGDNITERLLGLQQVLDNWQADLEIYQEIINNKFLRQTIDKFP